MREIIKLTDEQYQRFIERRKKYPNEPIKKTLKTIHAGDNANQ